MREFQIAKRFSCSNDVLCFRRFDKAIIFLTHGNLVHPFCVIFFPFEIISISYFFLLRELVFNIKSLVETVKGSIVCSRALCFILYSYPSDHAECWSTSIEPYSVYCKTFVFLYN